RERKADGDLDTLQSGDDRRDHHERHKLVEQSGGYALMRALVHFRLDLALGRFDDADRWFHTLHEICVETGARMPALVVAENFARAGKTAEALEWTGQALESDPDNFAALGLAARLQLERKEHR